MKTLLFITFSFICFSVMAQPSIKKLSHNEMQNLDTSTFSYVNLNYESLLDTSKQISFKEYRAVIIKLEAKGGPLQQVWHALFRAYDEAGVQHPDDMMKPPTSVSISGCGGCGCVTPGKAGYSLCTGGTCWCDCCPKYKYRH